METMWVVMTERGGLYAELFNTYEEAANVAKARAKQAISETYLVASVKPVARFKARPAEIYEEAL